MITSPAFALVVAALVAVLPGCTERTGGGRHRPSGDPVRASVVQVVDGDTVELRFGRHRERVRLLGIDTPETVKPDSPVECFGPEASARTKALLPAGTVVLVVRDREARDRFGRLLLYLYRSSDRLFVNRTLLGEGYARALSISPNTAHAAELAEVASGARRAGRGLWGRCPVSGS